MLVRLFASLTLLAALTAGSASATCLFPNTFDMCVRGSLYNPTPTAMKDWAIDLCNGWDTNCTAPVQTVFKLNGGQYYFQFNASNSWIIRPRVSYNGGTVNWYIPTQRSYPAGSYPAQTFLDQNQGVPNTSYYAQFCWGYCGG